ncbi:MAG: hypothetical protein Q9220_001028 [cf. Caloplaca sp. 1 TL-2023]
MDKVADKENPLTDHVFETHNLGTPGWPCPVCGWDAQAASSNVGNTPIAGSEAAINLEWHQRQLAELRQRSALRASQTVDVFGDEHDPAARASTTTVRTTTVTTTTTVTAGPTIASSSQTEASEGFKFNPATAIHGEFQPGKEGWKPDNRSRREKAIARNKERVEATNRVRTLVSIQTRTHHLENLGLLVVQASENWARSHPQEVAESALRADASPFQPPPRRGNVRGRGASRGPRGQSQRQRGGGRGAAPHQQQGDDQDWQEQWPEGQRFQW